MSENFSNSKYFNDFLKNIKYNKKYINSLVNQLKLTKINKKTYKFLNVMYTIYIIQTRTDTVFRIIDSSGNSKHSYSARFFGFSGKSKRRNRYAVVKKFISFLINSSSMFFLKTKPVAVHFKNVGNIRFWVIKTLKKKFYVESVRIFGTVPFNGCRSKKRRRV